MADVVAEGPDGRRRLEVVLVLGHDLDDRDDQVAGALPRGLGRREEDCSREAGLGGRGSDGTQYRKHGNHNTASERVPGHCSSHLVTILKYAPAHRTSHNFRRTLTLSGRRASNASRRTVGG